MATLTGKLVSETYKALLKMIDNDILTESEKQISDGFGQGTGIFIDDNGFIRASVFKVTGGSSSQFLKADGSLDSNSYLTAAAASALYLTRTEADGLYLAIGSTTSAIAEGSRLYFTTGRVLATTLTGFVSTAGTVTAADSILTAINKIWWNIINGGGGGGGYVPYTGATQNLNLGTYGLISDFIQFNLAPTLIPTTAGTMAWNAADGTADLKMGGGNVTLQVGQEELVRVVNKTGVNLLEANYQAVRISGAQGNRLKVALAKADNDANSADTIGLVTETINNNLEGFVTAVGLVRNIDTTGDLQTETWADGDSLYLSATTAGKITNIKPVAPKHGVRLGYVVSAHKTQGQIYVKVDNGYELDELHNVKITTPLDKDVLFYDGPNNLWINKNIYSAINATAVGQALLAIKIAANTTPVTTKPRLIRINVDNTVSALEVGKQGYLPYYDATKFYPDSPIFVNSNGKVIVNGETGFYDFTVIGELKADNLYVNTFSKIIAETSNNSLSFNTYDGTDWIQNLRLFNDGTIKQLIVTNTLIGTTSTGVLRAGTKSDIETILGAPAISGSLTENYIPIATDVDSITDSIIYQDGTNLVINGTSSAYKLQVNGTFSADELYVFGTGRITPNLVNGYVTHSVINSSTFNNVLRLHKNQDIQQFKITNGIVYADDFGYLAKATSGQIIAGLGFVPYNSTNPDGFIAPGTFFATNPLIWNQFTSTISMSQASDLNNGWLSASDWTTFNNKGGGSVTSVSATVPTGFAISGSPITTSGTLAITFASGYSLPTTVKQSNWDDAYTFVAAFPTQTGNAGKYLTTDGSSLSWGTVTAGVSSFNTRTGAIVLSSTDVTNALGFTPVTNARTLTINGTTYDLSADRAWTIASGVSSFNTRTGAVTLTSSDVTTALGFTPVTQARSLSINGQSYDLSADRSWTITAGSGMRNVTHYTATANQTTFTITGGYTVGLLDVFLNGVRIPESDFTATNGTTVVFNEGVKALDIITAVLYTASATSGITGAGTANYLAKWSGTSAITNSLIFDNGTNVGIGTATPFGKFNVVAGTNKSLIFQDSGIADTFEMAAYSVAGGTRNLIINAANLIFGTGALGGSSSSERMRILPNGNVGIGITNPTNTFEIAAPQYPFFVITATNGTQVQSQFGINQVLQAAYLATNTNHPLIISTNGTERMRITAAGNIGIGTNSPTTPLEVRASGGIWSSSDNNFAAVIGVSYNTANIGSTINRFRILANQDAVYLDGYDAFPLVFRNNGNTERMRITAGGSVGIGTANPSGVLEVAAPQYPFIIVTGTNSSQVQSQFGVNQVLQAAYYGTNTNHPLVTHTNGVERMRITASGQVLVNVTSAFSFTSYPMQVGSAGNGAYSARGLGGGDANYYSTSASIGYHFYADNQSTARFYVSQNGDVRNANNSYGGISDATLKENIADSTPKLNDLLKVKIRTYNLISDENKSKQLGVIAQELEEIFPALISNDKLMNSDKTIKTVKYSVFIPIMIKAMQEMDFKFKTQAEKIARLETRVQQLEAK